MSPRPLNLLDPYSTAGISVHIDDIFTKLILQNRKGCCLEHNTLFRYILGYFGFDCLLVPGKCVDYELLQLNNTVKLGNQHHLLIAVNLNGVKYVVDAGMGPPPPSRPIEIGNLISNNGIDYLQYRVIETILNEDTHSTTSLIPTCYLLQVRYPILKEQQNTEGCDLYPDWKPLYFFYLTPCHPTDLHLLNLSVNYDPKSYLKNHIFLNKFIENGKAVLKDNSLMIFKYGKVFKSLILNNENERRKAYKDYFDIDLPKDLEEHLPNNYGKLKF